MECSICCGLFSGTKETIFSTFCGHLYHETCIKQFLSKDPSAKKACPDCRQPMNDKTIHKIFLKMDDNQLLLTGLNDIRILFNGQEKKNDNMFKTLTDALEKITVSMSALEYQNELLRKENKEQKQMGAAEGNSKESSSMKEQMKAKDFMVANLQKEVNDLKSQRAETTREMNSIREQINHLKATAKGEKRDPLKDANEQKPKKLTLTFDNVSDKLIIE